MSRDVRVMFVRKGTLCDVTFYVAKATGLTLKERNGRNVIVRGGCGMDLAWDTVYHLGRALFPKGGPLRHSSREAQERRAGEKIERCGGYLLRHDHI